MNALSSNVPSSATNALAGDRGLLPVSTQ